MSSFGNWLLKQEADESHSVPPVEEKKRLHPRRSSAPFGYASLNVVAWLSHGHNALSTRLMPGDDAWPAGQPPVRARPPLELYGRSRPLHAYASRQHPP